MNKTWLQQPCSRCTEPVYYLPHWTSRPKHCHYCQIREIGDPAELLRRFLRHEEKLKKEFKVSADKKILAARDPLRKKISETLHHLASSPRELLEACVKDQELRTVVFRMARDRRRSDKPRGNNEVPMPKRLQGFVQGGAPGLGKRS